MYAALEIGATEALAFLVLARGSGGDNVTTKWSAKAVSDYAGMRRSSARDVIASLADEGVLTIGGTSSRPSYLLSREGANVWMPNALVDGTREGITPLAQIRQAHDPSLVRLLVDLYHGQILTEHGGIDPGIIRDSYDGRRLWEHGAFGIWAFDRDVTRAWGNNDIMKSQVGNGSDGQWEGMWSRLRTLTSFGLLESVPMLYDAPDGEPLHPIHTTSRVDVERRISEACTALAAMSLTESHQSVFDSEGWPDILAAVPKHIAEPTVLGTYRLTHRPATNLTASWYARLAEMESWLVPQFNRAA